MRSSVLRPASVGEVFGRVEVIQMPHDGAGRGPLRLSMMIRCEEGAASRLSRRTHDDMTEREEIPDEKCVQSVRDGAVAVRQVRGHPRARRRHARSPAVAAARVPLRHSGAHGRRRREGVPRVPRPAQRRPRPVQGRDPVSPAGDDRHGAGPGDVDDVEVLGRGHPAGRGEGRRHLRPAQPERARAGADLPGLGAAGLAERRRGRGRAGPRRHDDTPSTCSGCSTSSR